LGNNHIYQSPTCQKIYLNQLAYDPEGLLGCLTSCFLAYLGIVTGHILIHHKDHEQRRVKFLLYSVIYGLIGGFLCGFSKEDGLIPINKNLWSLSFILVAASIGYLLLIVLYSLIDVYDVYSGTPFLYLGRNSITIYICHEIFIGNFPFFSVANTHSWLLFQDFYGIAIWCTVAALMDFNKVYINL
jgi:heparan-alpha-glucosaminide N-acetyltransferase